MSLTTQQMGIDIYAEWEGQTTSDLAAQASKWPSPEDGKAGYLQEGICNVPNVTRILFAEAFENAQARIPAARLRERLDKALRLDGNCERCWHISESEIEARKQSYREFVSLCERKEAETGESVLIVLRI